MNKKPLVFTLANRKGGVAKTTNTVNLGYAYSQLGKKVLLIDADPQGSLTQLLGIDRNIGNSPELSISNLSKVAKQLRLQEEQPYEVDDLFGLPSEGELEQYDITGLHSLVVKAFYNEPISKADITNAIITPTYKIEIPKKELSAEIKEGKISPEQLGKVMYRKFKFGFDLIPSSEELTDDELVISLDNDKNRQYTKGIAMYKIIRQISKYCDYDIILIDTGPSLGILTINAIAAATDGVVISASVDEQSLWSLQKFKFNIRQVKQLIPGHEGILGVILGPVDVRSQIYPIISYKITRVLNLFMFSSRISRSANAAKATASGLLLSQLDEKAYNAYIKLASEILERYEQNHRWETERDEMVKAEAEKLKTENPDLSDEEIMEQIVERYSRGELWQMPRNDRYHNTEVVNENGD